MVLISIALDFKSLTRKELQQLCKQNKLRANDKAVNMAVALEAFRCSAVAVAGGMNAALEAFRFSAGVMSDAGGSAAEDPLQVFAPIFIKKKTAN